MSELLSYLVENEPSFRRARLPALYSDFRSQRTLNPDGYTANTSAWRRALATGLRAGLVPSSISSSSSSSASASAAKASSATSPSKITTKTKATSTSTSRNLLILTPDESLLRALESKQFGRPLALGSVVRDALAEREFIALRDFMNAKKGVLSIGKGAGKDGGGGGGAAVAAMTSLAELPWTLAAWALRQIGIGADGGGGGGGEDKLPGAQHPLVVVANVEAAAQAFVGRLSRDYGEGEEGEEEEEAEVAGGGVYASRLQRTFSMVMFRRRFGDLLGSSSAASARHQQQRLSDADMDVLLKHLSRDRGLLVYDGRAVRIKGAGEDDFPSELTEEDASIAALRELLEYLGHQTALLGRRVDELAAKAKEAVARGNRVAALAALRSKKLAEASLAARLATRGRLEEVADRIDQAADQVALVRVMEASAGVLKGLNERVGGAERVDGVMETLREQMGQVDEVASILAEPGAVGGDVVDEAEIDDELAAMEREEKAKKEEAERKVREEEERQRVEETRKRLEELEKLKPMQAATETSVSEAAVSGQEPPQQVAETTEGIRKMSLEEKPLAAG